MDRMETMDDRRLMRYLHGELSPEEAERLRLGLARDPESAARLRELERTWAGLELPPAEGAPPGFAAHVAARAAEESARRAAPFGPAWARAAAAAVLVAGLAVGASVGLLAGGGEAAAPGPVAGAGSEDASEWAYLEETPSSLAESYWSALEDAGSPEGRGETR